VQPAVLKRSWRCRRACRLQSPRRCRWRHRARCVAVFRAVHERVTAERRRAPRGIERARRRRSACPSEALRDAGLTSEGSTVTLVGAVHDSVAANRRDHVEQKQKYGETFRRSKLFDAQRIAACADSWRRCCWARTRSRRCCRCHRRLRPASRELNS
jgi:hypothetical protein